MNAIRQAGEIAKEFQGIGLLPQPSNPELMLKGKELDARLQLATMKATEEERRRTEEAQYRRQKELMEAGTADRLLELGKKAIESIADPISRAVGESLKDRAKIPPGLNPAPAPGPLTREQQIASLDNLILKASEAKEQIRAQAQSEPQGSQAPT